MNLTDLAPVTVILGHAGVGKTNTALGLALAQADAGHPTTLVDMDIVNPYFRSSDYPALLQAHGVHLVSPVLARTTLDTPSLSGEIDTVIRAAAADHTRRVIVDVGGDDDGATALGRYAEELDAAAARVFYAVSAYRSLTLTPQAAAAMLPGIEQHAHLRADGVINTSNLAEQTTLRNVRHGREFARACADLLGLPLVATVVPQATVDALEDAGGLEYTAGGADITQKLASLLTDGDERIEQILVMRRFVATPWGVD